MKPSHPYDDERLGSLLRLLRPAPATWIMRAQRIPLEARALTDGDVAELRVRLERDATFRTRFDADPVAAAEAAGLAELATQLRRELSELVALAERIARDAAYRAELIDDPVPALVAAGVPEPVTEPLLRALAAPEAMLDKLPEVAAHQQERASVRTRLLTLLLDSAAVGERIRSVARL